MLLTDTTYSSPTIQKPDYFKGRSMAQVTMASLKRGLFSGSLALKGGDIALLGGEMVIDKGKF